MTQVPARPWDFMPPIVTGVCWWNHKTVRALFADGPAKPVLRSSFSKALSEAVRQKGCVIGWSSRVSDEDEARCNSANIPLIRIEDGFLRSVGLGAGLAPAAALVVDGSGMYYDGTRPSGLERMLEHAELDDTQRARGAALHKKILESRLSKYNLGRALDENDFPDDRLKLLVPGQVTDDAAILKTMSDSIDLAAAENINIELLKAARNTNPDAFIIYKPHPDVTSDLRNGAIDRTQALRYADRIIADVDIIDLIDKCDKVETIASLSGFEALLRGKEVVVHGLPFYAGWGLTTDKTGSPRRTRRRSLDELVYLALIAYSRYVNPATFRPCEAEELIDALAKLRHSRWLKLKNALRLQVAWTSDKLNPYT